MMILFPRGSLKRRVATFIWNMSEFLEIPLGKKTVIIVFNAIMGSYKNKNKNNVHTDR